MNSNTKESFKFFNEIPKYTFDTRYMGTDDGSCWRGRRRRRVDRPKNSGPKRKRKRGLRKRNETRRNHKLVRIVQIVHTIVKRVIFIFRISPGTAWPRRRRRNVFLTRHPSDDAAFDHVHTL